MGLQGDVDAAKSESALAKMMEMVLRSVVLELAIVMDEKSEDVDEEMRCCRDRDQGDISDQAKSG